MSASTHTSRIRRAAFFLAITSSAASAQTYVPTSGTSDWNSNGNWTSSAFPNGLGESATFGAPTGNRTSQLVQSIFLGSLTLNGGAGDFGTTIEAVRFEDFVFRNNNNGTGVVTITNVGTGAAQNVIDVNLTPVATTLDIYQNAAMGTLEFTGFCDLDPGETLNKRGPGTLIFSGPNRSADGIRGVVNLYAGSIRVSARDHLGTGTINFEGGGIEAVGGGSFFSDDVNFEFPSTAFFNISDSTVYHCTDTVDNKISGPGGLSKLGAGTLIFDTPSDYTGTVTINAGTLEIGDIQPIGQDQSLGHGADPVILGTGPDHATLVLNVPAAMNATDRDFALIGAGGATIEGGANDVFLSGEIATNGASLIIHVPSTSGDIYLEGDISGSGMLTKTGSGTLDLFGMDSALGDMLIMGGAVRIVGAGDEIDVANVVVDPGASLQLAVDFQTDFLIANGNVTAANSVEARVSGNGSIRTSSTLTIGDAAAADGFAFDGNIQVGNIIQTQFVTFAVDGDMHVLDADIADLGASTLLIDGSTLSSDQGLSLENGETISTLGVLGTSTVGPFGNVTIEGSFSNTGSVFGPQTGLGRTLRFTGDVSGDGDYSGDITFDAGFAPGTGPDAVTIDGFMTLGAASTMSIEIGGEAPGDTHDQVIVTGEATLAGTLDLSYLDGYMAPPQQEFVVIDANTLIGEFDTVIFPDGQNWTVYYNTGAGEVIVGVGVCPWDFNGDGFVGAVDLSTILGFWGETGVAADLDGGGVGASDLAQLLSYWGPCP